MLGRQQDPVPGSLELAVSHTLLKSSAGALWAWTGNSIWDWQLLHFALEQERLFICVSEITSLDL